MWRLTAAKILAALEDGLSMAEFEQFLAAKSADPLPQPAQVFLNDLRLRAAQLRDLGPARLIECADASLAQLLAHDRRLSAMCLPAGDRHLVYRPRDEATVRRTLRELGYAIPRRTDE